jgi:hypothetical protein
MFLLNPADRGEFQWAEFMNDSNRLPRSNPLPNQMKYTEKRRSMPEKFNPNSFAPFLETIKSGANTGPTAPFAVAILQFLAAAPGSQAEIASLLSASELPIEAFAQSLHGLEEMRKHLSAPVLHRDELHSPQLG